MKNMHVPIPDDIHAALMVQAKTNGSTATAYVREAIERALWEDEKKRLHAEMRAYAEAVAGTVDDFDPALEQLGLEVWQAEE